MIKEQARGQTYSAAPKDAPLEPDFAALADQLEGWIAKQLFPIDAVVDFLGDNGPAIIQALRTAGRQAAPQPEGGLVAELRKWAGKTNVDGLPKTSAAFSSAADRIAALEAALREYEKLWLLARSAGRKLNTMYIRGECERRSEVDHLIEWTDKDALLEREKIKAALTTARAGKGEK